MNHQYDSNSNTLYPTPPKPRVHTSSSSSSSSSLARTHISNSHGITITSTTDTNTQGPSHADTTSTAIYQHADVGSPSSPNSYLTSRRGLAKARRTRSPQSGSPRSPVSAAYPMPSRPTAIGRLSPDISTGRTDLYSPIAASESPVSPVSPTSPKVLRVKSSQRSKAASLSRPSRPITARRQRQSTQKRKAAAAAAAAASTSTTNGFNHRRHSHGQSSATGPSPVLLSARAALDMSSMTGAMKRQDNMRPRPPTERPQSAMVMRKPATRTTSSNLPNSSSSMTANVHRPQQRTHVAARPQSALGRTRGGGTDSLHDDNNKHEAEAMALFAAKQAQMMDRLSHMVDEIENAFIDGTDIQTVLELCGKCLKKILIAISASGPRGNAVRGAPSSAGSRSGDDIASVAIAKEPVLRISKLVLRIPFRPRDTKVRARCLHQLFNLSSDADHDHVLFDLIPYLASHVQSLTSIPLAGSDPEPAEIERHGFLQHELRYTLGIFRNLSEDELNVPLLARQPRILTFLWHIMNHDILLERGLGILSEGDRDKVCAEVAHVVNNLLTTPTLCEQFIRMNGVVDTAQHICRLVKRITASYDDCDEDEDGDLRQFDHKSASSHSIASSSHSHSGAMSRSNTVTLTPTSSNLLINLLRVLSRVSESQEFFEQLAEQKEFLVSCMWIIDTQQRDAAMCTRTCYILGILTSDNSSVRRYIFQNYPGMVDALMRLLRVLCKRDTQARRMDSVHAANKQHAEVEDSLLKLTRLVANFAIERSVGGEIAIQPSVLLFVALLGAKSVDDNEELVLNLVSVLTNISFYRDHSIQDAHAYPVLFGRSHAQPDHDTQTRAEEKMQSELNTLPLRMLACIAPLLYSTTNMELLHEAVRVLGNLSSHAQYRSCMISSRIDTTLGLLLDLEELELLYSVCGVFANLASDKQARHCFFDNDSALCQRLLLLLEDCATAPSMVDLLCKVFLNLRTANRSHTGGWISYDTVIDLCDALGHVLSSMKEQVSDTKTALEHVENGNLEYDGLLNHLDELIDAQGSADQLLRFCQVKKSQHPTTTTTTTAAAATTVTAAAIIES
jgi:hypothetical protein